MSDALKDLEAGVFSDRLWPNLASWRENDLPFKLLYSPLVTSIFIVIFESI